MNQIGMSLMLFTHYLFGYVGTTMCSIGLVLTLCSVYVFTRRSMRGVVATYLTGLSVSDSCLLLLGLIFTINSSIPPNRQSEFFYSSKLHKYLFPYVYACIIWFQFTSVWIIIAFAIDRWFAIKWPMVHYTYSSKRAWYIVVTIYLAGFVYSLPRFFEYRTEFRREELAVIENYTEYIYHLVINNKLLNNNIYQYTVHLILYSLLQSILPLLLLSYFNVELIRSVHASSNFLKRCTPAHGQSTRSAGDATTSRYREGVVTRSVICLIGLFTICQVPASILHYIFMFYRNHRWLYICYDISNFLILFNSTLNFFIFACFNRKFRRELTSICCRKIVRAHTARILTHQTMGATSSHSRPVHQQHNLNIANPTYWKYQKRINNGCLYPLRKQSLEPESQYRSLYRTNNNNIQSKSIRYSLCGLNRRSNSLRSPKEMKSINVDYQIAKHQTENIYQSNNNQRYSLNPKKSSPSYKTNDINHVYNHK